MTSRTGTYVIPNHIRDAASGILHPLLPGRRAVA